MNKEFKTREEFVEFIYSLPFGTKDNCQGTYQEAMLAGWCYVSELETENGGEFENDKYLSIAQYHAKNMEYI